MVLNFCSCLRLKLTVRHIKGLNVKSVATHHRSIRDEVSFISRGYE